MNTSTPTLAEQGITQEDINEALHDCARYGELDSLKDLCDGEDTGPFVDYNCRDTNTGSTALHKASGNGHLDIVQYLCDKGCDYVLNENGIGPLSWAINAKQVEIVKYIIERFSNEIDMLLMPTNGGKSPVALAYDSEDAEIVSMVLMHPSSSKLETLYPNMGLDEGDEEMGEETQSSTEPQEDADTPSAEENVDEVADSLQNTTL